VVLEATGVVDSRSLVDEVRFAVFVSCGVYLVTKSEEGSEPLNNIAGEAGKAGCTALCGGEETKETGKIGISSTPLS
jgi:hypothetical protein